MPIFGKSKIGKSCFIDSRALIGYPHKNELSLLDEKPEDIVGCEIGDESEIRPGTVYSTAKLGKNTRTGHNFLVRENTKVGEKGSNLSGGQAQRIAIARALYQNPEILIMDEATNSLDTELEKNILKTLKKLDKSLLMVSHNLETLEICDRIYRLDNKTLKIIS